MEKANFLISSEIIQQLGSYLAQRPWHEVHQLIALLQTLEVQKESEESAE